MKLPHDFDLPIDILQGIFRHTTNSYKYLFFLSLMNVLREEQFVSTNISLDRLQREMLVIAWYPHTYFRLSFGPLDKVARYLEELDLAGISSKSPINRDHYRKLGQAIEETGLDGKLLRFVPYRLIRPFFSKETKGLADRKVNKTVTHFSRMDFDQVRPLYRLNTGGKSLRVHPDWAAYFALHQSIIEAWASWEWLQYMQKKNPTTPALAVKLFAPWNRSPLTDQRKYWKTVMKHKPLTCIYSGDKLERSDYALDHYLPWSFVAHDRLWNLVPVTNSANSAKSDRLPHREYLDRLIDIQWQGLQVVRDVVSDRKWEKYTEGFVADLRVPADKLLERDTLVSHYRQEVKPLLALAKNQGFEVGWRYDG